MVILSVDYGDKRTGVAVCDKLEMLAVPVAVITESYTPKLLDKLAVIIEEKKPELIVVGLPKNMDGSLGFRAEACAAFAKEVEEKFGIETRLYDERLTSVIAHRQLRSAGKKEKNHKNVVDAVAAVEILQSFLNSKRS